ncbi:MerR family transcriptional regulator [Methylotetracoccus oryzae]|uniref:MerR family transcriptional regulator n=1 Tax=Methylotetracoccus oryzae TaxID=1919059 RepID=UPI001117C9DA|nr:MerR family transcriptional regulator [Methylotetracoccus oryzae]
MNTFKYATIRKFSDMCGYSEEGIRQNIKKGIWREKIHWIRAPNGRILINILGVQAWFEGIKV